ncbi:Calcium-binding protein 1 [Clarias magur]|uniref:Calcium-binding protein 1 n=1 Tax=Clarias magur TaxID=1594786 RepID=A0A8J4XDX0_CLAMG|nr:Calcium-binding protein 1 [Clarias magur]
MLSITCKQQITTSDNALFDHSDLPELSWKRHDKETQMRKLPEHRKVTVFMLPFGVGPKVLRKKLRNRGSIVREPEALVSLRKSAEPSKVVELGLALSSSSSPSPLLSLALIQLERHNSIAPGIQPLKKFSAEKWQDESVRKHGGAKE